METLLQAVSTYSAAAVSALLSSMWERLVLAAGAWICLRLFPGLSAAARSVVWLNVFVLIALLHFLPSFLHLSGSGATGIAAGPGARRLSWTCAGAWGWRRFGRCCRWSGAGSC